MNPTQASRLLTLAWYLRSVPEEEYNQDVWISPNPNDDSNRVPVKACEAKTQSQLQNICGTEACALGHATNVFPGQFMVSLSCSDPRRDGRKTYRLVYDTAVVSRKTKNQLNSNSPELMEFFGLGPDDCRRVFGGSACMDSIDWFDRVTPLIKAQQIEDIVDQHGFTYADAKARKVAATVLVGD